MASKTYPKLGAKVWWTLRNRFQHSVPAAIDKNYLATVLGQKESSAGTLLPELKALGLIDDDYKVTARANHWRFDQDYSKVCAEIREQVYPRSLLDAVPDPAADLSVAREWFQRDAQVGKVAAGKMAALYTLLTSGDPSGAESAAATKPPVRKPGKKKPVKPSELLEKKGLDPASKGRVKSERLGFTPSVHIDIQIHISPDASADQIEQIFESMSRHLFSRASGSN